MQILLRHLKKHKCFYLVLLLFLAVSVPSLLVKWSMVDDGQSARVAYFLSDAIKHFNGSQFFNSILEPSSGRFRPGYWIYIWITFLVAGQSSFFHHLIQIGLFGFSALMIFLFTQKISGKMAGYIATAIFISSWQLLENWYRLGPQEPIVLPLMLLALWLFLRSREKQNFRQLIVSLILVIMSILIKETVVAFLLVASYLLIADLILKQKKFWLFDLVNCGVLTIVIVVTRIFAILTASVGGYGSNYVFTLKSISDDFQVYAKSLSNDYTPIIEIILFVFILRLAISFNQKGFIKTLRNYYYHGLFLTWSFAFFAVQLPWTIAFDRYLLLFFASFSILSGDTLYFIFSYFDSLIKFFSQRERVDLKILVITGKNILLFLIFLTLIFHLFQSINYIQFVTNVTNFNEQAALDVARITPINGHAYMNVISKNEPNLELYKEFEWHLHYLLNRSDINYAYIDTANNYYLPGSVIINSTVPQQISNDQLSQTTNLETQSVITTSFNNLILNNPRVLTIDLMNILGKIVGGGYFDTISMIHSSAVFYQWKILQVK